MIRRTPPGCRTPLRRLRLKCHHRSAATVAFDANQSIIVRMAIISRADARRLGLATFFTGIPCKNGHVAERSTAIGKCLKCKSIQSAEHYKRHRDRISTQRKCKYADKPTEEKRLRNRKLYKQNRAIILAKSSRRYSTKRNIILAKQKIRKRNDPHFKLKLAKWNAERRARLIGVPGKYTLNEIDNLAARQKYKCANCGKSIKRKHEVDHIVPLKLPGATNDIRNIQLLCVTCNRKKSAKDPIEWAREQGRLL